MLFTFAWEYHQLHWCIFAGLSKMIYPYPPWIIYNEPLNNVSQPQTNISHEWARNKNSAGIQSNDRSKIIYAKQEQRNGNLVKHLLYYSTFVIVSIYLPPFLFPIAYAIFGFPGPKHWYLPYPTVFVYH